MFLKSSWKVFVNAKSLDSARRIANRVNDALSHPMEEEKIDPYYKGGYIFSFELTHDQEHRSEVVVRIIGLGQRLAKGWQILGPIEHEPSGWSNEPSLSGVEAVGWELKESGVTDAHARAGATRSPGLRAQETQRKTLHIGRGDEP